MIQDLRRRDVHVRKFFYVLKLREVKPNQKLFPFLALVCRNDKFHIMDSEKTVDIDTLNAISFKNYFTKSHCTKNLHTSAVQL